MKDVIKFVRSKTQEQLADILSKEKTGAVFYCDGVHPFGAHIHGFSLPNLAHWGHYELIPYSNIPRYRFDEIRRAMQPNPFKVGQRVKFDSQLRHGWLVRAVQDEFAILTNGKSYTIADVVAGIRGPDNCYGIGYEDDEQIQIAMRRLTADPSSDDHIEISRRHSIPLSIGGIK